MWLLGFYSKLFSEQRSEFSEAGSFSHPGFALWAAGNQGNLKRAIRQAFTASSKGRTGASGPTQQVLKVPFQQT